MLMIESEIIGQGSRRDVYLHPHDKNKIVKVNNSTNHSQSNREVKYYKKLQKKCFNWDHIPKFYGTILTNKGKAMILEYILDFDDTPSKSLEFYLKKNGIKPYLEEIRVLKQYFLDEGIIFNDISPDNILLKRTDLNNFKLILIDGLGDVVFIKLLNYLKYFLNEKILKRWSKLENTLKKY